MDDMPLEEEIRLLSMVDVLEPLSQEQLDTLAQRYPDISLEEGQYLYTPQEASERLYFLKEGRVRIYRVVESREATLAMVEEGTVFGEMALTDQRLWDSYARAEQKSTVFAMDRKGLEELILPLTWNTTYFFGGAKKTSNGSESFEWLGCIHELPRRGLIEKGLLGEATHSAR